MRPGVVTIELAGERVHLIPTLRAGDRLNRAHGGFRAVVEGLARWDLDVMTDVVMAGANLTEDKRTEARQAIFDQGVAAVSLTLGRYVGNLANGGRPPSEESEDAPGKPEAAPASPGTSSPPTSSGSGQDGSDGHPTSSSMPTSPTSSKPTQDASK